MSGPLAEMRFAGYSGDTLAMMWRYAWAIDRRNAQHWLGLLGGSVTPKQAEKMARQLVEERWPMIVRVAEGELNGARIEALFRFYCCVGATHFQAVVNTAIVSHC